MDSSNSSAAPRRVPVIGLTGAPAAGKSSVAHAFAAGGCTVIDVDALGHEALADEGLRLAVTTLFGPGVLGADGRLDRSALARRVFGDKQALARLESLVHPEVRRKLSTRIEAARRTAPRAVALECALLFESGLEALCDATVYVDAPAAVREARAVARGWSPGEVARREAHQLASDAKRARADHVLSNDDEPEALARSARALLDRLVPGEPSAGTAEQTTMRPAVTAGHEEPFDDR